MPTEVQDVAATDEPDCTDSTPKYHAPRHHNRSVTGLVSTFTDAVHTSALDKLKLNHTEAAAVSVLAFDENDTHEPAEPAAPERQLPDKELTFTDDSPQPNVSVDTWPETGDNVTSDHTNVDGRTTPDAFDTELTVTDQRLTVTTTPLLLLVLLLLVELATTWLIFNEDCCCC